MTPRDPPPAPFRIGERFEKSLSLDAQSIGSFASMVGDPSPLHHDEAFARDTRFGGLIASGAQISALMAAFTAHLIIERTPSLGLEVQFQFREGVKADEPLLISWVVSAIEPKPRLSGCIITFTGQLTDSTGAICVSGQAKALILPTLSGYGAATATAC